MFWINLLGGSLVLASYAGCFAAYPAEVSDFWGGVPERLRGLYAANMLLAAAGYLAFTCFLLFRSQAAHGRPATRTFNAIYAAILFPSALWMPLTFAMLLAPSTALWFAIRVVLAVVGIGSVAMLVALVALRPREARLAHALAVAGAIAFSTQTAILDALVWPAYFGS
jgi:hypothetical protein